MLFQLREREKNTLKLTGNGRKGGKTTKGSSGIKQHGSGEAFFQSQNPSSHGTPLDPVSGRHAQGEVSQGSSFSPTTSISVITVSIITVICISHGRVLVLTPQNEQEGSQGKQSVEARHLFQRVASGAKQRDSLGQQMLPLSTFEETLWDELLQGSDFLTEIRAKCRLLGRLCGLLEPGGGFSSKPLWRTAPIRGSGSAAWRALPGARCWDPDQHHGQSLPRPPGTSNSSRSAVSPVCTSGKAQLQSERQAGSRRLSCRRGPC